MKGNNMSYGHNILWSNIPKNAQIYDLGGSWVVHMPDGRKGLVYWGSTDDSKAQNMLKMRALPKSRMPCKKWRWNGFPGDECFCGAPKIHHERNISEEDYQKALKTAKGIERVNLMRQAANQLENNPTAGWPMSGTQRRIAGLRAAATRLERRL
jgi:hypothetical protein